MSQSASESTSGNVNFGDPKPNTWLIVGIIGAVIVAIVWLVNRK